MKGILILKNGYIRIRRTWCFLCPAVHHSALYLLRSAPAYLPGSPWLQGGAINPLSPVPYDCLGYHRARDDLESPPPSRRFSLRQKTVQYEYRDVTEETGISLVGVAPWRAGSIAFTPSTGGKSTIVDMIRPLFGRFFSRGCCGNTPFEFPWYVRRALTWA